MKTKYRMPQTFYRIWYFCGHCSVWLITSSIDFIEQYESFLNILSYIQFVEVDEE